MAGRPLRQDYLQAVLGWLAADDDCDIATYMAKHQHDTNAKPMWDYYEKVMRWVRSIFTVTRKEMKGQAWGVLYDAYHETYHDAADMEKRIVELMSDDEVTNKRGVYTYVLDGDERHLNLRQFTPAQKRQMYERQKGVCPMCHKHYAFGDMDGDHVIPWCRGGKTELSNGQMLCRKCNHHKSVK
jgi:hypothetical protein